MADDDVRLEIGFTGGAGVNISCDRAQWEQLQASLGGATPGWVTITARDEAEYLVATDKVVYVRVATLSRNIGFKDA